MVSGQSKKVFMRWVIALLIAVLPSVAGAACLVQGGGSDKKFLQGKELYENKEYEKAVKVFSKLAEKGHAEAQFYLGLCYYNGEGVSQSYSDAVKWYSKSAEQGNADAQNNLGLCYYKGEGVPESYSDAMQWWSKSAEQGNADAQNYLGECYYYGYGVPKNSSDAVKWWRKSAEQGNAYAQYHLGVCYYNGEGVPQSYSDAVKWFSKSAEQGYVYAQFNLGECYENGDGVPRIYADAVKWYRKSAEQGYIKAQYNLAWCYYYGYGVPQSYSDAVQWWSKSAEQGYAAAQYRLGLCYAKGYGVPQSYSDAVKWYSKSAEQGHAKAQYNLGLCYYDGKGVPQSYSDAVKWFNKAAEQGQLAVEFKKLTREVKEKTFKLEYEIQYPVGGANEAQVEGIRKWINKELGEKYKGDLANGNVVLDKNVKAIASEWRRDIRQTWGDEDEMVGNMSVVIAVGCEYGQCITMTNNYEGWDGDGFGALEGATFLADGSLVTWDMFNTDGDFQKLLKKEIKSFIDETDRKNGDTFAADDLGDVLKSRVPTPQCPPMLTADGVRFVYNRYEVGEFMSPEFTVPYDIIKPLMKPALVGKLGL